MVLYEVSIAPTCSSLLCFHAVALPLGVGMVCFMLTFARSSPRGSQAAHSLLFGLGYSARAVKAFSRCSSPSACWSAGHRASCSVLCLVVEDTQSRLRFVEVSCGLGEDGKPAFKLTQRLGGIDSHVVGDEKPYEFTVGSCGSV